MNQLLRAGSPLAPDQFHLLRRRAIFECCKWDPQLGDLCTLCDFPLLLKREIWFELARLAEQLASEALAAEGEIAQRPDLCQELGLPRELIRAMRQCSASSSQACSVRCCRFDFHLTPQGWRISEGNTDVPGGYIEAAGFAKLMAELCPGTTTPPDPAATLVDAMEQAAGRGAQVALVHATAYADDHQVMAYLARRLSERGLSSVLVSPDHLRWSGGRAVVESDWHNGPADYLIRFYPAEWLSRLPPRAGWTNWFASGGPPRSNPATALLTQSKRFPLIWPELSTPLPTWRALLPETRDPRQADFQNEDWVLKPALGRVGELVGLQGVTEAKEWRLIERAARREPGKWIAQRRFEMLPLTCGEDRRYPMLGVFTIGGRAAGIYGRIARQPLINANAQDVAVLLEE